jgi:hypothetical protein
MILLFDMSSASQQHQVTLAVIGQTGAPNVQFLKVEKETRTNCLANTRIEGNTRIQTYEDQERERRTGYDGHTITYSD